MSALASRLSQRAHEVTLVTLGDGQGDRHEVDASVQRRRLNLLFQQKSWLGKVSGNRRRVVELEALLFFVVVRAGLGISGLRLWGARDWPRVVLWGAKG